MAAVTTKMQNRRNSVKQLEQNFCCGSPGRYSFDLRIACHAICELDDIHVFLHVRQQERLPCMDGRQSGGAGDKQRAID